MDTFSEFLLWEELSRDVLIVKRIYIKIVGDLLTGVALSQIVRWHFPSRDEESKVVYSTDGPWIVVTRDDWWDHCRIKPKQADGILRRLKQDRLITVKIAKFSGTPKTHIQIQWSILLSKVQSALEDEGVGLEKALKRPGYIYLISSPTGHYKIGKTIDVPNRINTLRIQLPFHIKLVCYFHSDDYVQAERELHETYSHRRTNGEWFKLTPGEVEAIKAISGSVTG